MGFFQVEVRPDIINGDVSNVINSNKTDLAFGNTGDILFDWQVLDVPKGASRLENCCVYITGEDGGTAGLGDIHLVFAKSINGVAPGSLGAPNAAQTACFELPLHLIGAFSVEGTTAGEGSLIGPTFGTIYNGNHMGNSEGGQQKIILQGEPDSGSSAGYDTIYVAAFSGASLDFSTGVLLDMAGDEDIDASEDTPTTITVDGVDPRKAFQVGDQVYVHDLNTPIPGTIASMTSTTITFSEANSTVDISNNDEMMCATPIKFIFGFEK